MFPQYFAVSHTGNIVSSDWFLLQDADYTCATRQGILTKIRACEHLQKFCEHEHASTHLIFASTSRKGKILRALSNWMGPFYTPTVLFLYSFWTRKLPSSSAFSSIPTSSPGPYSRRFSKWRIVGGRRSDDPPFSKVLSATSGLFLRTQLSNPQCYSF